MNNKRAVLILVPVAVFIVALLLILILSTGGERSALDKAFLSEDGQERTRTLDSLRQGDEESLRTIAEGLQNPDGKIRAGCASLLGEIKGEKAVELLLEALNDEDVAVWLAAIESLGKIGDKRAVFHLVPLLAAEEQETRIAAIRALGTIGDPAVVAKVEPLLAHEDGKMRLFAAVALGELKEESSIPVLIELLGDRTYREQAFLFLKKFTGLTFNYDRETLEEKKLEAIDRWRDWWHRNSESFQIEE